MKKILISFLFLFGCSETFTTVCKENCGGDGSATDSEVECCPGSGGSDTGSGGFSGGSDTGGSGGSLLTGGTSSGGSGETGGSNTGGALGNSCWEWVDSTPDAPLIDAYSFDKGAAADKVGNFISIEKDGACTAHTFGGPKLCVRFQNTNAEGNVKADVNKNCIEGGVVEGGVVVEPYSMCFLYCAPGVIPVGCTQDPVAGDVKPGSDVEENIRLNNQQIFLCDSSENAIGNSF